MRPNSILERIDMENIFELPYMAVVKYHKFLQVKSSYDLKDLQSSNLSFTPGIWENEVFYFVKATDFLPTEEENDVNMIVSYNAFNETIKKAESIRFMEQFKKEIIWSLQKEEM